MASNQTSTSASSVPELIVAVLRRPGLWLTALRQGLLLRPNGGWLPMPDRAYLGFRSLTQYGEADRLPNKVDLVSYLRWLKAWRGMERQRR